MVEPTYKDHLEIPGGAVEAGEAAPPACKRECREELGIRIDVGRLLVIDHQNDGGYRGDSIMCVYDGGVLPDPSLIRLPADELAGFRFVAPTELDEATSPRIAHRLRHALAARAEGSTIELVNGKSR